MSAALILIPPTTDSFPSSSVVLTPPNLASPTLANVLTAKVKSPLFAIIVFPLNTASVKSVATDLSVVWTVPVPDILEISFDVVDKLTVPLFCKTFNVVVTLSTPSVGVISTFPLFTSDCTVTSSFIVNREVLVNFEDTVDLLTVNIELLIISFAESSVPAETVTLSKVTCPLSFVNAFLLPDNITLFKATVEYTSFSSSW